MKTYDIVEEVDVEMVNMTIVVDTTEVVNESRTYQQKLVLSLNIR